MWVPEIRGTFKKGLMQIILGLHRDNGKENGSYNLGLRVSQI